MLIRRQEFKLDSLVKNMTKDWHVSSPSLQPTQQSLTSRPLLPHHSQPKINNTKHTHRQLTSQDTNNKVSTLFPLQTNINHMDDHHIMNVMERKGLLTTMKQMDKNQRLELLDKIASIQKEMKITQEKISFNQNAHMLDKIKTRFFNKICKKPIVDISTSKEQIVSGKKQYFQRQVTRDVIQLFRGGFGKKNKKEEINQKLSPTKNNNQYIKQFYQKEFLQEVKQFEKPHLQNQQQDQNIKENVLQQYGSPKDIHYFRMSQNNVNYFKLIKNKSAQKPSTDQTSQQKFKEEMQQKFKKMEKKMSRGSHLRDQF